MPSRATGAGSAVKARSPTTLLAPGKAEVEHWCGSHIEAGGDAIQPDQRASEKRGAQPRRAIAGEAPAERRGGRVRAPVRRPQTGDSPALLVDHQHRCRRQSAAQGGDECGKLRRIVDVAREQDHAGRRMAVEQVRFFREQYRAGDADDDAAWQPGRLRHVVSNRRWPMNWPSVVPPGQANRPPPVCVTNWFSMSNFAMFSKILMKPVRGSRW